ncbi:hypothetical protein [Bacillus sp. FJAT-27445]|uniref:hypothetical protein n=1 Tax=Bacillus sp. FJAT-27445 TaxID=1679166 RepID=UPI0007444AC7|nr:hypothetical protein [Bacillus sp. FJAT-27445]
MKGLKVFKQWIFLFVIGLVLGSLAIIVDVSWVKKALWIALAVVGAVSMGKFYQMYEYGLDKIEKKS